MSSQTICLPAHILDAAITPRAREVLMVLASQTSGKNPTLWICQPTLASRLRCSVSTITRAIQKLIEAKLVAETGELHEGRYKFYHVRWSLDENIKIVAKKITKPVRKVAVSKQPVRPAPTPRPIPMPVEGIQLIMPPVAEVEVAAPGSPPSTPPSASTITPQTIMKDSRLAHYAEIARQKHAENLKRHQEILRQLR